MFLVIGYSVFSINVNLIAKGNVYKVSDKCYRTSDNGSEAKKITIEEGVEEISFYAFSKSNVFLLSTPKVKISKI